MEAKSAMLIVNPAAGKGKSRARLGEIISEFGHNGYIMTVFVTEPDRGASYFAEKYGPQYDTVVCIGGDGTLSDTVNGLMQLDEVQRPNLGYIPMGSTNDVATTLRIPLSPLAAVRRIAHGKPAGIDIGRFGNDRFFTYVAAFGAFTEVSYATPQRIKKALGHLAYILSGIGSLASIRERHVHIEYDGGVIDDKFIFGGVTNTTSVAGIVKISPSNVKLGDGLFEVLLIKKKVSLSDLNTIVTAMINENTTSENMILLHTSHIRFTFDEPVKWTRDGEAGGVYSDVEITNCPRAINLLLRDK